MAKAWLQQKRHKEVKMIWRVKAPLCLVVTSDHQRRHVNFTCWFHVVLNEAGRRPCSLIMNSDHTNSMSDAVRNAHNDSKTSASPVQRAVISSRQHATHAREIAIVERTR